MSLLEQFAAALADRFVEVTDLTNPLSADRPTPALPESLANLSDSPDQVSACDEPGRSVLRACCRDALAPVADRVRPLPIDAEVVSDAPSWWLGEAFGH